MEQRSEKDGRRVGVEEGRGEARIYGEQTRKAQMNSTNVQRNYGAVSVTNQSVKRHSHKLETKAGRQEGAVD